MADWTKAMFDDLESFKNDLGARTPDELQKAVRDQRALSTDDTAEAAERELAKAKADAAAGELEDRGFRPDGSGWTASPPPGATADALAKEADGLAKSADDLDAKVGRIDEALDWDEKTGLAALASKGELTRDQKLDEIARKVQGDAQALGVYVAPGAMADIDLEHAKGAFKQHAARLRKRATAKRAQAAEIAPSGLDTGHYDDGHALAPSATPEIDTGHYDDGHGFGWGQKPEPTPPSTDGQRALPIGRVGAGAAVVLVLAVAGFAFAKSAPPGVSDAATSARPSAPATIAATAPSAAATRVQALDACALVSPQEALAILGQPVTTRGTTPPGPQCELKPAQRVVFSFQETSRTAQIRIDAVVIAVYVGDQATARWNAKQAAFGRNAEDQQVTGVGDKAIFNGASSDLSVLRGTAFVNVATQSDLDWGEGTRRYEDVHEKYLAVLADFARAVLGRIPV